MKPAIHPEMVDCTVTCSCGYTFVTLSTEETMRVEICANCHPYFTGTQRLVDTAGQVERFNRRFGKRAPEPEPAPAKKPAKAAAKDEAAPEASTNGAAAEAPEAKADAAPEAKADETSEAKADEKPADADA
ncbi:MAG: 50S ribosomal protein L31 [Chloroflexota bacterium]|jgi:large subunit ribosomal protein L31|nr:50S ribosomal protein L31 [Chloroflexota bacterium]MDP6509176.1 50S ribosomal protein L31 [Chloroflexota bacterium]MDP6756982.1 50S ribosomal protein L31 [Chloroflexota bacterium]